MRYSVACAAFAGAVFLFASPAVRASDVSSSEGGTLSILFENDIFYHTDRDYTNGLLFGWTSAPDASWDLATDAARLLPYFQQDGVVRTSYTLGQNIYTPSNLHLANPDPADRPYAGFLYVGLGVADETDSQLDQAQLQLGVVGPDSLAENAQKFVHRIIHDTIPAGWAYQLSNEPAFVLIDEKSWRTLASGEILGFSFDVDPHVGAAVGTVYDYANAGATARFGLNLPDDYGPLRIEPALPGTDFFEPTGAVGAYIFAGVDGRAVARNIFLDGNTWQDSRHVTKNPLVGDLQLGAALTFSRFRLSFTHVFRTREFTTQHHSDQFGAINLSMRL
ncbi:MAG TPA: lipid A deacylase LpxR family protein [Rhizomicrobium sp.]|nr:lipid A deacylase LpxR family protein [Rhizomicrobium sp.]